MDLKSILKSFKLHESTISMILGALVIVIVGTLVVNYFRNLETGTTLPTGTSTQNAKPPTTHTVSAGETLWSISETYYDSGYNWVDIAKENNLVNPGQIETGQRLAIPDVEARQPTVSLATDQSAAISGATYTVVRGDNLWSIAVRAYGDGYRWVDIAGENNLTNPNLIHPGNVFVLPR